jgi:hypothetical protein
MITLDAVQFVVGKDGQPIAVQVGVELWQQIVSALEDAEDISLAQEALAQLEKAGGNPELACWISVDKLRDQWLDHDEP